MAEKSNRFGRMAIIVIVLIAAGCLCFVQCGTDTRHIETIVEEPIPLAAPAAVENQGDETVPPVPEENGVPKAPADPETPANPADPETPVEPQAPSHPETPQVPEVPENPTEPENPGTPENPDVPEDPSAPEQPAPISHAALLWMLGQLEADGTTINGYFAVRGRGTSLDSTGLNYAPIVNAEMIAAVDGLGDPSAFGWRIWKGGPGEGFNLFFSEDPVAGEPVGTALDDVAMTNTLDTDIVDGSAVVGYKTMDDSAGNEVEIEIIQDFVPDPVVEVVKEL